jgi:hypothetical protein
MSSAQTAGQTLYSFSLKQIKMGGDYEVRIKSSRQYHEACGVIRNADAVIAKAEEKMALEVLYPEIRAHYKELVEGYWQSRNFKAPLYTKGRMILVNRSMGMTREYLTATYPALVRVLDQMLGTGGYEREYMRAVVSVDRELKAEWEAHNPITYTFGGMKWQR